MTESEKCSGPEGFWEALLLLPTVSRLKRFLCRFQHPGPPDVRLESGGPAEKERPSLPGCGQRLLLPLVILLALVAMALLLLWNYQCIFVWHLCKEGNSVVPLFGDPGPGGALIEEDGG